jgi:hypothetical protein
LESIQLRQTLNPVEFVIYVFEGQLLMHALRYKNRVELQDEQFERVLWQVKQAE